MHHLGVTTSDHVPLMINISANAQQKPHIRRSFKFENMWTQDDQCGKIVEESWNRGIINNMSDLVKALGSCCQSLMRWHRQSYGSLTHNITRQQKELQTLQQEVRNLEDTKVVEECKLKLKELEMKEKVYWRQRSKSLWLKEGDRNS